VENNKLFENSEFANKQIKNRLLHVSSGVNNGSVGTEKIYLMMMYILGL